MLEHPLLQRPSPGPVAPAPGVRARPEVAATASGAPAGLFRSGASLSPLQRQVDGGARAEAPPLAGAGGVGRAAMCALAQASGRRGFATTGETRGAGGLELSGD